MVAVRKCLQCMVYLSPCRRLCPRRPYRPRRRRRAERKASSGDSDGGGPASGKHVADDDIRGDDDRSHEDNHGHDDDAHGDHEVNIARGKLLVARAHEETCTDAKTKTDTSGSGDDSTCRRRSFSSSSEWDSRKLQLLDTIARVQRQYLQSEGPKVTFGCLLDALLELMESEYGFIGEVKYEKEEETGDQIMYLQNHAITNIAWNAATRAFYEENKESGLRFYNLNTLFGRVMTSETPIVSNTPRNDTPGQGVPEGHPPLNCFLGIPFFKKGGEINGMVGIANKPGGYSQDDIEFLEPFTITCGNLIHGYWQIERNKELICSLEEKVKERTRELENLNQSLAEANRRVVQASAAQLQHFACMSHEIRTPLNCIIGLSSLLEESENGLNPSQQESVKMIVKSGDLLLTVVNDLLDYSKLESGNVEMDMRSTSLQDTVNAVVHSIEVQAQTKQLSVQTFLDPRLPEFIHTDSKRLSQILYNLLGNAVKFSHASGRIEVFAELIEVNDEQERAHAAHRTATPSCCPRVRPTTEANDSNTTSPPPSTPERSESKSQKNCPFAKNAQPSSSPSPPSPATSSTPREEVALLHSEKRRQNGYILRLKVRDYGKGIEKKDHERIFKPFSQASAETERMYGGTGLGLAITSRLTKALDGTISVDSEVGKWTLFTVDLPFRDIPVDFEEVKRQIPPNCMAVIVAPPDTPRDHTLQHLSNVFRLYGLPYKIVPHLEVCAFQEQAASITARDSPPERRYVCIAHADLFGSETYHAERAKNTCPGALITFGSPKPCQQEDATTRHVRSLTRILPSVLMNGIIQLVQNVDTKEELLPRATSAISAESSSSSSSSSADKKQSHNDSLSSALEPSKRILVAEDNLINQKVLLRMLKRLGLEEVDVVENGQEAVKMEQQKAYDVILMDMQMPVMDGVEACRRIVQKGQERRNHPVPPIVFVTANVSASFEAECKDAGGAGFLSKPFNIRGIRDTLLAAQERLPTSHHKGVNQATRSR